MTCKNLAIVQGDVVVDHLDVKFFALHDDEWPLYVACHLIIIR